MAILKNSLEKMTALIKKQHEIAEQAKKANTEKKSTEKEK